MVFKFFKKIKLSFSPGNVIRTNIAKETMDLIKEKDKDNPVKREPPKLR